MYISAHESYAMELFQIHTLDFLIKPIQEERVIQAVERAMNLSDISGKVFTYRRGGEQNRVLIRDILYFRRYKREIHMVTYDSEAQFYGKMEKVIKEVERYQFFFCHKSYLVNYNQVKAFRYDSLTMSNDEVIPISQAKRKEIRDLQRKLEGRFLL